MREDPIVDEVRQVREELERQFDFDVKAIFADLRRRQLSLGARLVQHRKTDQSAPGSGAVTLHPGR